MRGTRARTGFVTVAGALLGVSAAPVQPAAEAAAAPRPGACGAGELCLWEKPDFGGARRAFELKDIDIESCVPLPRGTGVASFVNRTGRPATVYQSAECAETAEFHTYPSGTWVPESAYRGRAFKVWKR